MIWAVFGLLLLLLFCGIPVFASLLIAGTGYFLLAGSISPSIIPQVLFDRLDSFPLMAAPFFILAGNLLSGGKLARYMIDLMNSYVGWIRGGLGISAVAIYVVLAAMTGVSIAAVAAVSPILVPGMVKCGYKKDFAAAICAGGGCLSILIPPSISFIVYGAIAELSVGKLFIAGLIPGIIYGIMMALYIGIRSGMHGIKGITSAWRERIGSLRRGILVLTLPVAILGGIYGGVVTPTEAGALACLYTAFLVFVVYRTITIRELPRMVMESTMVTAMVFLIVASASVVAFIITLEGLPQALLQGVMGHNLPLWLIWVLVLGILFILGCFLDSNSIMVITTPIVLPVMVSFGVDPILYGVVLTILIDIGLITPPVGMNLFVLSAANEIPVENIVREIWPFVIILLAVTALLILVPDLTLWLPNQM